MKCALCRKPTKNSLCNNCWKYAVEKLQVFPDSYNQLAKELIPSKGTGERVGGSKTPPIPVRLETLHLRTGGISRPLMAHEAQVRVEQHHTRITFRGQEINRITITCKYLTSQAEWIFDNYTDVATLAEDINSIHKQINNALGFKSDLMTIGVCPSLDEEGTVCGAKLQINPTTLTSFGDIKCRVCKTVWPSQQWRLLGKALNE
jgi:hypothetical protein